MFCSIVIPLYNKARFIETTIESVLNQTYQNFEILVIDDGSTDNGASLVALNSDRRVRLIQQINSGVASARNRGIKEARGELICFLDADDWYLPVFLETIVSMARAFPDIDFFATGVKHVSTANALETAWDYGCTSNYHLVGDFFHRWLAGPFFITCSAAVRRTHPALIQPCFPPGESMGEDLDLWFKLAGAADLAFCPAQLAGYRVDVAGSLCATNEVRSLLPVFTRLEQRALRNELLPKHRSAALRLVTEAKVSMARASLVSGSILDALKKLFHTPRGVWARRWWVTFFMCMLGSSTLARYWEDWRHRRKQ
jgi:cellulose synthase/poly-beta-1,6-N-acetylglucosamine synthase-like glycosyltransferase